MHKIMSEKLQELLLNPDEQYENTNAAINNRDNVNINSSSSSSDYKLVTNNEDYTDTTPLLKCIEPSIISKKLARKSSSSSSDYKLVTNNEDYVDTTPLLKCIEPSQAPFSWKFLLTSVLLIFISSVFSAFILGQWIESIISDKALNKLIFAYFPYTGFILSFIASLISLKNIKKHRISRLETYEIISIITLCYSSIFASIYIGNKIGYLKLTLSYLSRISVIILLALINNLIKNKSIIWCSCIFLGFYEAFIVFYFEFNLQCFILICLLIFANIIAIKLIVTFKLLKSKVIKCSIFLYLLVLLVVEMNGPLLNFFSSITIILNISK